MKSALSILIVDDAKDTLFILEKALSREGFKVFTSENVINAVEIIKKNNIDIVISDINMPEINGLDFLFWIQENSPRTKVILITSLPFEEIQSFITKSSIMYFEKPVKPKELIKYINENLVNKSFYGDIKNISILDLLKILIISGKSRLIEIKSPDNKIGRIYIKNMNIIHAEYNNISGETAFYNIIKIKNGYFKELQWEEPDILTIDKPYSYLLNEANRILLSEDVSNKILVVDDDLMTVLIIEKYLKQKGFNVTAVNSAVEGMELLKKENFGFIISDINMPDINGLEFLIWLREYSPYSKIIMITSLSSDKLKDFATSKGVVGYFNKPVSLRELEEFIRNKQDDNKLEGSVLEINLIQFIEMLFISNKSNVIRVFDPIKNKKGEIFIKEGKIVHASIEDNEGEEAFYDIIRLKSGLFSDENWYEPEYYTIITPTSDLIKKANDIDSNVNTNSKQLVKSRSKIVQKALNKKKDLEKFLNEKDNLKKLTIYVSGVALGIVIGKTTKFEAIEQLKKFSKTNLDSQISNKMIIADDITVSVLFNDNDIVEEMIFGKNYRGKTEEGIQIGDPLEKVILIYGKPKVCTIRGAVWDNMAFFSDDNKTVSSIKIKNVDYFDSSPNILKRY